jgi:hypothetical protein
VGLTDKGPQESERLFSKLFVKASALIPFAPPLLAQEKAKSAITVGRRAPSCTCRWGIWTAPFTCASGAFRNANQLIPNSDVRVLSLALKVGRRLGDWTIASLRANRQK